MKVSIILLVLWIVKFYAVSSNRRLRQTSVLAKEIKQCRHWKFQPSPDPREGNVFVELKNAATSTKNMTVILHCNSMKLMDETRITSAVGAKKSKRVTFMMAVESRFIHYEGTIRRHQCTISTHTQDPNTLVKCSISIDVWPHGMFFHTCKPFKHKQLEATVDSSAAAAVQVLLKNTGPQSIYLANSSCSPALPALHHTDLFTRLANGATWLLEFPKSCTGTTGMNYRGKCRLTVSHLCQKNTTFVRSLQFAFVDGEIEECEFMKASYAVKKLHKLAKVFGTSGAASAALTVVIITELALITVTLGFKLLLHHINTNKRWSKARDNFINRFKECFHFGSECEESVQKEGSLYMHKIGWSTSIYNNIKHVWKGGLDLEHPALTEQPSDTLSGKSELVADYQYHYEQLAR